MSAWLESIFFLNFFVLICNNVTYYIVGHGKLCSVTHIHATALAPVAALQSKLKSPSNTEIQHHEQSHKVFLIIFPHCFCWAHPHLFIIVSEMLRLCDFFFPFAFMRRKLSLPTQVSSCQPVSQGPSDWFCSSDTCHPVSSQPEVCFLSPLSPYKD